MCILSFLPAGLTLGQEGVDSLWNGGLLNDDGHGWAIADRDQMILGKSLKLDEALEDFIEAREKHPNGPALFHSRWATHGSIRVGNCHPFLVGGSHKTVLAHNGVLPKDAHPFLNDDRSDTAILAEELMPKRWFRLDRPTVRQSISQWAGKGNKLVILTVDRRYRENAYIINEGSGNWDTVTGMWHSNYDYLPWPKKYPAMGSTQKEDQADFDDPTRCYFCGMGVDTSGYCENCQTCQDCYEHFYECQCYEADLTSARAFVGR